MEDPSYRANARTYEHEPKHPNGVVTVQRQAPDCFCTRGPVNNTGKTKRVTKTMLNTDSKEFEVPKVGGESKQREPAAVR